MAPGTKHRNVRKALKQYLGENSGQYQEHKGRLLERDTGDSIICQQEANGTTTASLSPWAQKAQVRASPVQARTGRLGLEDFMHDLEEKSWMMLGAKSFPLASQWILFPSPSPSPFFLIFYLPSLMSFFIYVQGLKTAVSLLSKCHSTTELQP